MAFEDLAREMNDEIVSFFGEDLLLHPAGNTDPIAIRGVISGAAEPEPLAPGHGSMHAYLFMASGAADVPDVGDEVSSAAGVYTVLRPEKDEGGGLRWLLHFDREPESS